MSDFPTSGFLAAPPFLSTYSRWSAVREVQVATGAALAAVGTVDPVASYIHYYPMTIPFTYVAKRAFWVNGTAAAGNRDFGVYTKDGVRLYSTGSTAASGTSQPQFVTISSPLVLQPGDYFFAWVTSSASNCVYGTATTAAIKRMAGILQENTAIPLPATATFAASTQVGIELCGLTWTETGF